MAAKGQRHICIPPSLALQAQVYVVLPAFLPSSMAIAVATVSDFLSTQSFEALLGSTCSSRGRKLKK